MDVFSKVMISSTFFVSTLIGQSILRTRSFHVIAVESTALCADNISLLYSAYSISVILRMGCVVPRKG